MVELSPKEAMKFIEATKGRENKNFKYAFWLGYDIIDALEKLRIHLVIAYNTKGNCDCKNRDKFHWNAELYEITQRLRQAEEKPDEDREWETLRRAIERKQK